MKKNLRYITIKGKMVARGEYATASDEYRPYEAVTFVDENGEEVHFSYLTISKRLDEKVRLNEPRTFYIFRQRERSKIAGVLYAIDCEGEKICYPETAVDSITSFVYRASVRATMLTELLILSSFLSLVLSFFLFFVYNTGILFPLISSMVIFYTIILWPKINKKNRAGIPEMYQVLSSNGFSTTGTVNDKY